MAEKRQNSSQSQSSSQTQTSLQSSTSSQASQTGSPSPMPTIPSNAPPGVISITQPPQQSIPAYKIAPSDPITFAWEFVNVIVTPTHLTLSAVCEDGNTYPVGPTNGIIPGSASSVVWDTYAYQTSNPQLPLAQAKYTLEIWGDQGPTAQPEPGLLSPNSAVQFSLYTPQGYSPVTSGMRIWLSEW